MLGTSLISDTLRSRYAAPLEQELRQSFAGQKGLLYDMLVYQLGWVDEQGTSLSGPSGEHLHPCLCLLSCESLSGEFDVALPAAAAVELVHNFILIHEDVQSGSPNRGHRPSVWWTWGPGQAINAGDGMHALGRLALMRLQERGLPVARVLSAMLLLDRACLSMCEGQHMDLIFQERLDVGVDAYLKMAEGRSGALMSCAMALGALASTEDEAALTRLQGVRKEPGDSPPDKGRYSGPRRNRRGGRVVGERAEQEEASADSLRTANGRPPHEARAGHHILQARP